MLAALGPRMLELAAARSAGAHPYFVPVEHTARARDILGPGPLLAPEVAVVLETDPARARELARGYASTYLACPTTRENLRTFGFGDDDIDEGGSDRLIDAVIPWGDVETIGAAVAAHHDAGADHVCVQVVGDRAAPSRLTATASSRRRSWPAELRNRLTGFRRAAAPNPLPGASPR